MPAGIRFKLDIGGIAQFDRTFIRYGQTLEDLSPVWEEVKQEFWEIEQDQFQSGGAAGASGKWAPLSPRYEAQKINRYGTFALLAGTLQATQDMYKSLTRETGDSIVEIGKKEARFGTKLARARYHQDGGGNLPKREVISLSGAQKRKMQKRIQKKMIELLRAKGEGVFSVNDEIDF